MRTFDRDDYSPEYSLLVLRGSAGAELGDADLPRGHDDGTEPTGTFAGSGAGWITAQARSDYQVVRLELHDGPPPDDPESDDRLEMPYRGGPGGLALTMLTGGAGRRPDLDRRNADQHAAAVAAQARKQGRLDEIAAKLGVPPVRRRRDMLPLLAAAGLLVRERPDEYRAGRPEPVHTVLSLPPERVRQLRQADLRSRYDDLAVDVASVLRWAPEMPYETSVAALAERLLVAEADLRDALAYAETTGQLHADGDNLLRLGLGRRSPEPPRPVAPPPEPVARPQRPTGAVFRHVAGARTGRAPEPPLPPFGAPPRAGVVESDGTVVTWSDGARVELAHLGGPGWNDVRQNRALETRQGVLVTGHGRPARLVSAAGEVTEIDEIRQRSVVRLGDGRHVAYFDSEHHRERSRYRLRVIDLAGGPVATLPWPADREISLVGAYRDAVFFVDQPSQEWATMRWAPGAEPEPYPRRVMRVDPLTGATAMPDAGGVAVTRPGATTVHVPVDTMARLAPGGDRLWTVRTYPPALTLFPVEPAPQARVMWLPDPWRGAPRGTYELKPIWEDTGHVLFAYQPAFGVRLSLLDGSTERIAAGARGALLVEPLLTP